MVTCKSGSGLRDLIDIMWECNELGLAGYALNRKKVKVNITWKGGERQWEFYAHTLTEAYVVLNRFTAEGYTIKKLEMPTEWR